MDFSQKLKKQMKKQHISVQELAEKTGIGKTTINDYTKGTYPKSLYYINELSKTLNVSAMYLADDEQQNENYIKADVGKELNISDEAIEKIKEVKGIIHFDNDIYYNHNFIRNEIIISSNYKVEDVDKKMKEVELTYNNKTFSYFIEHFYNLNDFIKKFRDFIKLKEMLLNIDNLKTICQVKLIIEKYMKEKNKEDINKLINIYDTIFEALQFTSYGSLLSYNINDDIKNCYNKVKDIMKSFDVKNFDYVIDELQSNLYQSITYINKELRSCEYEMNFILSKYYENLISEEKDKFLAENTNNVNTFINNLIKENKKIEKEVNNGSTRNRKK